MKNLSSVLGLSLCSLSSLSFGEVQSLKRNDIIDYAKTAVGSRYVFGGSAWDPNNRKFAGPDCAGLVLKAWRWPMAINYKDTLKAEYKVDGKTVKGKLYTGTMLMSKKYNLPWSMNKQFSAAEQGDAFTFNNGTRGHTFLVTSQKNGIFHSLEARSSKLGVGYFERSESYIRNANYYLMKRNNVVSRARIKVEEEKPELKPSPKVLSKSTFHVVVKGDTLEALAKKYKVPASHIVKLNSMKIKNNVVKVGDKIQVS